MRKKQPVVPIEEMPGKDRKRPKEKVRTMSLGDIMKKMGRL